MSVTIRPTTAADVAAYAGRVPPWRIRAITVRNAERILGIGGIAFLPGGTIAAFLDCSEDDAKAYPVTLWKAARQVLQFARETGQPQVVAEVDRRRDAATRFLVRLGFVPAPGTDETIFVRVLNGTSDDRRPRAERGGHDCPNGGGEPAG